MLCSPANLGSSCQTANSEMLSPNGLYAAQVPESSDLVRCQLSSVVLRECFFRDRSIDAVEFSSLAQTSVAPHIPVDCNRECRNSSAALALLLRSSIQWPVRVGNYSPSTPCSALRPHEDVEASGAMASPQTQRSALRAFMHLSIATGSSTFRG